MQPINYFADILSKIYFWNLDDQSRIFNIQMVGFGWRIACLFFIAFVVFRSFRDVFFALFFLNALLFALSGWMLRMLGKVIEILPIEFTAEFKSRSVLAFQDFPHENLEWYDFGLFAILAIIAVIVPRLSKSRFSIVKTILVGVLFTSFFEYLGFVLAISWILFNVSNKASTLIGKKSFQIGTLVGFGSMIWFISINFYRRFMQATYPKFFNSEGASTGEYYKSVFWAIRHPIENLTSNPSIPFQIILVISQSALMGIILGLVARKIFRLTNFDSKLVMLFKFITIATGIVMFINFFVAYGVEVQATEHSRQTLGLQIALFTYLFLQTASSKKIDKLVGANN